jgi:hypothetical protein
MKNKLKKLPHDYLKKYLDVELSQRDYNFIKGCLHYQELYFQLNYKQWEAIGNIEKRYLCPDTN